VKKQITALLMAILLITSSMSAIAPPAEAARRLQMVEEAPRFRPIYFADGVSSAGNYYCQIPRNGAFWGLVSAYGGYYVNLRNRPTLQLRRVAAAIAVQGGIGPTTTYDVSTIVGANNIGENGKSFLMPSRRVMRVGFSGFLYGDTGREPLYVTSPSGTLDVAGEVVCPSWQDDGSSGEPLFLPGGAMRVNLKVLNNIVKFVRKGSKIPGLEEVLRLLK
jgi:hypothetical protein